MADREGKVNIDDLAREFKDYYVQRLNTGQPLEQDASLMAYPTEASHEEMKRLLIAENRWYQFVWIKCKVSTDKVLQIELKPELKKREGKSPDFAEGLMLCFSVGDPSPMMRWI